MILSKKPANPYQLLLKRLSKESLPYKEVLLNLEEMFGICVNDLETTELLGLGLSLDSKNMLSLKSRQTLIKDQIFCVIDIEATGSTTWGELLEIGAVKVKNKKIIDSFESLVRVSYIPPVIVELTGINARMIERAPRPGSVLSEFKLFLKDSIFVAHNANFDFSYLDHSLKLCDLGPLLNQKLCTYQLSRKLIDTPKHGLAHLKEHLDIKSEHHRALSDARAAAQVLFHCLAKLPPRVKTTQELLDF